MNHIDNLKNIEGLSVNELIHNENFLEAIFYYVYDHFRNLTDT